MIEKKIDLFALIPRLSTALFAKDNRLYPQVVPLTSGDQSAGLEHLSQQRKDGDSGRGEGEAEALSSQKPFAASAPMV